MFRRILALIRKEFIMIWKDKKSRSIILALPIIQLFIFANAITMEVTNIDLVILDRSNTFQSRELISRFDASTRFRTLYYADNERDLKQYIELQKAQLGLEIENDFAKKIKSKTPTSVQIIADGRQTNSASIASAYASQIVTQYANEEISSNSSSINYVIRNWFNTNLDYKWYILQVLVTLLALVVTLLLTALSIAREREMGTFDQLIVSPLNAVEILIGKTVPPLCISVILTIFMTTVAVFCFKIKFVGNFVIFIISTIFALLAIVGVGLFISSICTTQQQAILGCFTFQTPSVILSGFISPIEDMPKFFQIIAYCNPTKYFMTITKGIFFKNMPSCEVFYNTIFLFLIAVVTLSLAGIMLKKKLD